ncbi:MAG: diacylglycerol kinase family protein [Pseudomonadota bacterium]
MSANYIPGYYLLGAILALVVAIMIPGWPLKLVFGWTFLALTMVASAYWLNTGILFRKRQSGKIPSYIRWLLVPFLLGVQLYNAWARRQDRLPGWHAITDDLYVGRRLFSGDIDQLKAENITAILDVTAEFDALDWSSDNADIAYLNAPVLDHKAPSEQQIHQAIQWIQNQHQQGKKVLVHCALGRGRSVFMIAVYLLMTAADNNIDSVLKKIKQQRQVARLNDVQREKLTQFANDNQLLLAKRAWVIANPVSGGGKWQQEQSEIKQTLAPYFQLEVMETTLETGAEKLAKEAVEQGAELVIACGGDGTLTAVASVLKDTNVVMAIIPMGTANSLSQALWGMSSKISPVAAACHTIIEGRTRSIDVGNVNGQTMLLCAAIGFEQQMIEKADRQTKNKLGQLAYLQGLWRACNENEVLDLQVTLNDQPTERWRTSSLIVANAAPITTLLAQGNGSPMMDDGQLDLTWIEPQESGNKHVFSLIELLYSGLTEDNLGINTGYQQAEKVHIQRRDKQPLKYAVDGEPQQHDELEITVEKQALTVLVPERIDY